MRPEFQVLLLVILLSAVGLLALWRRIEAVREELRLDPSGALSLRAVRRAYAEMDRGGVLAVQFEDIEEPALSPSDERRLAQARREMQAALRETDIIGRRGAGFVVLLPGASRGATSQKAAVLERRLGLLRPRGLVARIGVAHTDDDDPWGAALARMQDLPRGGPPWPGGSAISNIPHRVVAEVAGAYRARMLAGVGG